MTMKKDIERQMFYESYNTRVANIADTIGGSEEEIAKKIKALDFKDYVDLMRALRDVDGDAMRSILDMGDVEEAYNMGGTISPSQQKGQAQADAGEVASAGGMNKQQKAQALQRLGKKNLGGATGQMAANAIDRAEKGAPLSPIERKAMAAQAGNINTLATDPRTAQQFRNLLNKINSKK
jgi:hypothetical protein